MVPDAGYLANGQLTIGRAAQAAGGWAWAERSLYEVVGRWASSSAGPAAKVYFDEASQHHAWRWRLWQEQLGGRLVQAYGGPGPSPQDVTRPFSPATSSVLPALAALGPDVERAAVYTGFVLARAAQELRRWQARLAPASDRPLARALFMAANDVAADLSEGTALLNRLVQEEGDDAGARAAAAGQAVERLVAGEELVFGG